MSKLNGFFIIIILFLSIITIDNCKNLKSKAEWVPSPIAYDEITYQITDTVKFADHYLVRGIYHDDTVDVEFGNNVMKINFLHQMHFGICDTIPDSPIIVLTHFYIGNQRVLNIPISCKDQKVDLGETKRFDWIKLDPYGGRERSQNEQLLIKTNLELLKEFIRTTNEICKPKAWRDPGCG